ncbi:MAG: ComEC/Rec2 family competence protein, partial [bacterium]
MVDSASARVAAGTSVRVLARSIRTSAGLRLTDARVSERAAGRARLVVWRARLGQVIDAQFRRRAPLVRALLIADQHGIPSDVRELYADAGLIHLLSVSGMHVAFIASALLTLG